MRSEQSPRTGAQAQENKDVRAIPRLRAGSETYMTIEVFILSILVLIAVASFVMGVLAFAAAYYAWRTRDDHR